MTLVAGSPCVKIFVPASYSTRCAAISAQSIAAAAVELGCFDLLMAVHLPSPVALLRTTTTQERGTQCSLTRIRARRNLHRSGGATLGLRGPSIHATAHPTRRRTDPFSTNPSDVVALGPTL